MRRFVRMKARKLPAKPSREAAGFEGLVPLPTAAALRRELRDALPEQAFGQHPEHLRTIAGYFVVSAACLAVACVTTRVWLCAGLGVAIGVCSYSLASLAHYLSHGAFVRNRRLKYVLEYFLWGWLGHSATVWTRTHNQMHHAHANGTKDTDRRFAVEERRWDRTVFHWLFQPHRHFKWNPLTLLTYGILSKTYIITAVLGIRPHGSPMGPVVCQYTGRERLRILLELGWAYGLQVVVYHLLGFDKYLATIVVAYLVTNAISSLYLHTQHGLSPLLDPQSEHPLRSSANVDVGAVWNWLHSNVAYHVEHHLFPSLNPSYAPQVSALLREKYGAHYQTRSLWSAWKQLFEQDLYLTRSSWTA
jgi:fatty acid desaturase